MHREPTDFVLPGSVVLIQMLHETACIVIALQQFLPNHLKHYLIEIIDKNMNCHFSLTCRAVVKHFSKLKGINNF